MLILCCTLSVAVSTKERTRSFPYSHGSKGTGRENAWELKHPTDPFWVSFISHVSFPLCLSSSTVSYVHARKLVYTSISSYFSLLLSPVQKSLQLRQFPQAVMNNIANLRLDIRFESQFCVSWPESKMGTLTEGSNQHPSVRVEKVVKDFWSKYQSCRWEREVRVTLFAVCGSLLTLFLKLYRFLYRDFFVEVIAPNNVLTKIGPVMTQCSV